jgi:hypothetical protein
MHFLSSNSGFPVQNDGIYLPGIKREALGLIHTRHFGTQYCDKKIKRYWNKKIFLSHRFQYPTKVSSEKNVTYLELRA